MQQQAMGLCCDLISSSLPEAKNTEHLSNNGNKTQQLLFSTRQIDHNSHEIFKVSQL